MEIRQAVVSVVTDEPEIGIYSLLMEVVKEKNRLLKVIEKLHNLSWEAHVANLQGDRDLVETLLSQMRGMK